MFPLNTETPPAQLWLGLFDSQTASTVPAQSAVLSTQTGVTEVPNADGYSRWLIDDSDWSVPVQSNNGLETAAPVAVFQADVGTSWSANGFFLADDGTWGAGRAIAYFNFDDLVARTVIDTAPTLIVPRYRVAPC